MLEEDEGRPLRRVRSGGEAFYMGKQSGAKFRCFDGDRWAWQRGPLVRRRRASETADDRAGGQAHGGGHNGGQNGIFDGLGGQGKIEHGKRTDGSKHAQ